MAGLLSKQSLYDRHNINELGDNVGGAAPSAGTYFASEGQTIDSPFINGTGDHMVDLLTQTALSTNTTGINNTAVGANTLDGVTTGGHNTGVGLGAMGALTTGGNNVAVGSYVMDIGTGFNYNVAMGHDTARQITTGSNNVCLGHAAGHSSSPSGQITTSSNNFVLGNNSISNLYCADTSISSSDARDKTDVTDFTHGLSWIKELRPVTYRWDRRSWYTEDSNTVGTPDGSKKRDRLHIGFIAQEFMEVEKKHGYATKKDDMLVVNQDENDEDPSYGIKYERLVPVLVNAIKELEARLSALEG